MEAVRVRLCLSQMDICWEDKGKNLLAAEKMMRSAASDGADLIVFPELSLTGFTMDRTLAEAPGGFTESAFRELSAKHGIAACFGFACRTGEVITNRCCAVSGGETIAVYDKIHPFSYGGECAVYSAGSTLAKFELSGEVIGLTICYDLRFPEIYQALSEECSLIVNIASWPDKRSEHWKTLLKARAIETQSYIAGCDRCGSGGGLDYSGDSAVYSPEGKPISQAEPYKEQLIFAQIDHSECGRVRNGFPVKNDRRTELYRDFYAK